MIFIFIAIILIFVFEYNRKINTKRFIKDSVPYLNFLMEDDYKFLLNIRYNGNVDVNKKYERRLLDGFSVIILFIFILFSKLNFIYIITALILGYLAFKLPYMQLQKYYKANLHQINLMLPYYLKSLEILIQHYTVPVALSHSIDTAPEIFKSGLKTLISKIEAGDSSVDPYMDFAKEYPVRDSMRMMRLLYRLGLGSQENKQEQLMMFSRTVSTLQNKSREQKYRERLEKMENQTMLMLGVTGGGILLLMLFSIMMMMQY
ncbi:MAG: hypothetical protein PHE54_04210 [Bacilli bacterium]|nr:hypothetical protein [Bacilli bacterium]